MFKVIHTGDLHYSADTLIEVDRCMEAVVTAVSQDDVNACVIGGDSTDHKLDAHTPAFLALARRVHQIASLKPLLMLQGTFSHEPQGMLSLFSMFNESIFVADRVCQVALLHTNRWVASKAYRFTDDEIESINIAETAQAVFTCVPTLNKGAMISSMPSSEVASANAAAGNAIADLLAGFSESNIRFAAMGIPTIGVSHGTVRESKSEHGVPMHGTDHEYNSGALFAANCSAFLLNHIHLHQSWEVNERRIAYSGSLPCLHYGEREKKVFLKWSVEAVKASFEALDSPAQKFIEFSFLGEPNFEELRAANVFGAKVRVRFVINTEDRRDVDIAAVKAALVGAVDVQVEPRLLPTQRTRAAEIAGVVTHIDRLKIWAEANDLDIKVTSNLADALAMLATSTPRQIARDAIARAKKSAQLAEERSSLGEPALLRTDVIPTVNKVIENDEVPF
jgi:DNA repair protein SbcD/Mre11